jgi:hypothetical protein
VLIRTDATWLARGRALPPIATPLSSAACARNIDADAPGSGSSSSSMSSSRRADTESVTIVNTTAQATSRPPSSRDRMPLRSRIGTAITEPTSTGTSRRMIRPSTVGGLISAVRPRMSEMFAAHEPITVPSAMGWLCASAVFVATASSGALVP